MHGVLRRDDEGCASNNENTKKKKKKEEGILSFDARSSIHPSVERQVFFSPPSLTSNGMPNFDDADAISLWKARGENSISSSPRPPPHEWILSRHHVTAMSYVSSAHS